MWSFKTAQILLVAALPLASCGFTPVYGPDGVGTQLQNRVLVDEPLTRNGYLITRHLETRLGRTNDEAFALSVTVKTQEVSLAIDADGVIERYNLIGTADYTLINKSTGAIAASGQVESFTGYSATGTPVAALAAERDASERLMVILGDKLVAELQTQASL
ncbi:LPS assembly lipoprotein LptE [Ascidiaceihabitans sp.]|uniref:LPS assembly lipoprotein LptE n=1 Tax=Ascidiaceihabitans sp. TaxID=1872644 RepID=UPI003299F655